MGNIELKRVIPVLTLVDNKLVKTVKFKNPNYIGDPINAVKIFNDKEVDEVILLDIRATVAAGQPNYNKIEELCSEAFMPFAYGGAIKSMDQVDALFNVGIEKVVLNSILSQDINLVRLIKEKYGAQSIAASIDVKKGIFRNYQVYSHSGKKKIKDSLIDYVKAVVEAGVGEIFLNSIDRDGTFKGYDLELIKTISSLSRVPVIASGGARNLDDFKFAFQSGASAVAAGSMFVYRGEQRGILINYPTQLDLKTKVY